MYNPEESLAANAGFDEIQARIDQFTENILPHALPNEAEQLGEKMKQCVEVLRRLYDEYLDEFDPDRKKKLHETFHVQSAAFLSILKKMAENI